MRGVFRLSGAVARSPAVEEWLGGQAGDLRALAQRWLARLRACGPDVRELMHDGAPTLCVGDAAFAYVNVFKAHASLGFFHGTALPDPQRMLEGDGKYMRHVKLRPGTTPNAAALEALLAAAYDDIKVRVRAA